MDRNPVRIFPVRISWNQSVARSAAAPPASPLTSATWTETAALGLWPGFIDVDGSPTKVGSIQSRNGLFGLGIVRHFNESEASRLPRITVGDQVHTLHRAIRFEKRTEILLSSSETEVPDENIFHLSSFSNLKAAYLQGRGNHASNLALLPQIGGTIKFVDIIALSLPYVQRDGLAKLGLRRERTRQTSKGGPPPRTSGIYGLAGQCRVPF